MPFTFAHPAAVLPLRHRFRLSALVIGSMAPDAGYFLSLDLPRDFTHTPFAILWFCLPLSLLAFVLYNRLLRAPMLALLPSALARRLPAGRGLPQTRAEWGEVVLAIVIGVLTHLVWDELTHPGWSYQRIFPWLRQPLFQIDGHAFLPGQVVQHLSTVIGLGVLALASMRWWLRTPPMPGPRPGNLPRVLRWAILLAGTAWVVAFVWIAGGDPQGGFRGGSFISRAARAFLPAMIVAVFVYALAWQLWGRLARTRAAARLTPSSSADR